MKKIVFLIRALPRSSGGAERQLVLLAKSLSKRGFEVTILCFYTDDYSGWNLSDTSIKIRSLEKRNRLDMVGFFWRLFKHLQEIRPDILHSYLPDSNVISIFLKPLFPNTRMVWGVRHSNWAEVKFNIEKGNKPTQWVNSILYLEQKLSRFADLIIANSTTGKNYHISKGFPAEKTIVIPNGIDVDYFKYDPEAGAKVRQEWSVSANTILIGAIGRLHPMKDHPTFLRAAALLLQERKDILFVCVGREENKDYTAQIYELTNQLGITEKVIWAGERFDIPNVYNALDILVSSSAWGEGFSNVIAEAMACGKPCIATDVGDSAMIIGDCGIIVPPGDPLALKVSILELIRKLTVGNYHHTQIRQRIVHNFVIAQLLLKTERAILSLK